MNYPLYRDTLCPRMWHMDEDGYKLDAEVKKNLSTIAQDFVDNLKKDYDLDIKIHDVVIIGSVANYNWTDYSDIDLHIVTDFSVLEMSKDDAQTLFDAIKVNWNNKHNIKMKGHDVEIYVQDINYKPVSSAEYSVIQNKWLKEPKKESPTFNKELIKKKHNEYKKKIDSLIKQHDEPALKKLLEKLYNYRQAGLDKGGELSEENIVFKILRAQGYLDKLKDGISKSYDKKMSVDEVERIDDGISSPDGEFVDWDYDESEGEFSLVPTDNDDDNRFFTVHGNKVYGAFVVNPKGVHAMKTADKESFKAMKKALVNLRKAVKHPEHGKGSKSVVKDLVKLSVKRLFNSGEYDATKINVIIPFGSRSKLNYIVAAEVKKYLPNAIVLENFLEKDKWKNVQLSPIFWKTYNRKKQAGEDISYYDYVIRDLETKKKNRGEENFEIKHVGASNRLYYSMFYKTVDGYSIDLIKKINGSNLLLIDDTLEAGATLIDATRAIKEFNPADTLTYIFLYGKVKGIPIPPAVDMALSKSDLREGAEDIAKTVYQSAISSGMHVYRDGNTLTVYGIPSQKQMQYLRGKSGRFAIGNREVNFSQEHQEPSKIKFIWQF